MRGSEASRRLAAAALREGAELRLRLLDSCLDAVLAAGDALAECFRRGGKVLLFGNGGSAADAQHLAAELVGRFCCDRAPLPALALTSGGPLLTALGNDFGLEELFARQVRALGARGDVALAISTSGRSPNVLAGVQAARETGLTTLALTAEGSELARLADLAIAVPSRSVPRIQECHIAIGHILCELVDRLEAATAGDEETTESRAVSGWDALLLRRERWRALGKTVVWTNGCFDLLHLGHIRCLKAARSLGDVLVVGVNGDSAVERLKGPCRPIMPAVHRAEILASLDCVDAVVIFEELTPEKALLRLRPDVHCKGSDYAPPNGKAIPEAALVASYGGRVEFFPRLPGLSSSDLLRRICEAAVDERS